MRACTSDFGHLLLLGSYLKSLWFWISWFWISSSRLEFSNDWGQWISWPNTFWMKEMRAKLRDVSCALTSSYLFALSISCCFQASSLTILSLSLFSSNSINCICICSWFLITFLAKLSRKNSSFFLVLLFLLRFPGSVIPSDESPPSSEDELKPKTNHINGLKMMILDLDWSDTLIHFHSPIVKL